MRRFVQLLWLRTGDVSTVSWLTATFLPAGTVAALTSYFSSLPWWADFCVGVFAFLAGWIALFGFLTWRLTRRNPPPRTAAATSRDERVCADLEIWGRANLDSAFDLELAAFLEANERTWSYDAAEKAIQADGWRSCMYKPSQQIGNEPNLYEAQRTILGYLNMYADCARRFHAMRFSDAMPPLATTDSYKRWRQADDLFVNQVRGLLQRPRLGLIHELLPPDWGAAERKTWPKIGP